MAILVKSKTPEGEKNRWATRWECFYDARYVFKRDMGKDIVIDVAAEPETTKVDRYYLPPDWVGRKHVNFSMLKQHDEEHFERCPQVVGFNALQCPWEDGWWCNPPFDLKVEFIKKATQEMFLGRDGMMLIPYEPLSVWWRDHVDGYASMVYEPNGRYAFYETDGKTKKHGVNFGSVLVLFSRRKLDVPRQKIDRGMGKALLDTMAI